MIREKIGPSHRRRAARGRVTQAAVRASTRDVRERRAKVHIGRANLQRDATRLHRKCTSNNDCVTRKRKGTKSNDVKLKEKKKKENVLGAKLPFEITT